MGVHASLADDREDTRLGPSASLGWARRFGDARVSAKLSYGWLRQWSSSYDYDTSGQQVSFELAAGF